MKRMPNVAGWREREGMTQSSLTFSSQHKDSKTGKLKPNRGKNSNPPEENHSDGSNIIKDAVDAWKRFQQKQLKSK